MTDQAVSRAAALRQIKVQGIDAVLVPAGYEPVRRSAWVRQTSELQHVIALLTRRGTYDIQWGIVSPEAAPFLWGVKAEFGDVGAAVMSGTPGTVHHPPACQSFRLDLAVSADRVRQIVNGLSTDVARVDERLRTFETRKQVRDYLLLNRDATDRRDFVIPAKLPLKMFTVAALAVVDGDPVAADLVAEAEQALAPFEGVVTVSRLARLREGLTRQGQ